MLDKVNIDVPFVGGKETDTAQPFVIPSKLLQLTNGQFDGLGGIAKRSAWVEFNDGASAYAVYDGASAPSAPYRAAFGFSGQALLEAANGLYAFDQNKQQRIKKSLPLQRCGAELVDQVHELGDVTEVDSARWATASGGTRVTFYASRGQDAGIVTNVYARLTSIENDGRETVVATKKISSNGGSRPRVILSVSDSKYYLYWFEANSIKSCTVDMSQLSVSATNIVEATAATPIFDATLNTLSNGGRSIFICHNQNIGANGRFLKVSMADGFTIVASFTHVPGFGTGGILNALAATVVGTGATGATYACAVASGSGVTGFHCLLDGAGTISTIAIGTGSVGRVTAAVAQSSSNLQYWTYWDDITSGYGTTGLFVKRAKVNSVATIATAEAAFLRGVGIGSRQFTTTTGTFIGIYLYSDTQPSFYVVDTENTDATSSTSVGTVVAANLSVGPSAGATGSLSLFLSNATRVPDVTVFTDPDGDFDDWQAAEVAFWRAVDYTLAGGQGNITAMGCAGAYLRWGVGLTSAEIADSLVLAGACPMQYDGNTVTELGFLHYPETASNSVTMGGVGGANAGLYQIVFVFEYVDKNGRMHRSAPSVPILKTATAGQAFGYRFPSLKLTLKKGVRLTVFRTEVNGALFHRVQTSGTQIYGELNNQSAADVVGTAIDTLTDAQVRTGELLYTTGNALANKAFPACRHVESHNARLFMVGCEIGTQIRYTDEFDPAFFPATNEVYTQEANNSQGDIACVKSIDDKLMVFQENQVGFVAGTGPNRLGLQNDFSQINVAVRSYGMDKHRPQLAAVDDMGVWFFDNRRPATDGAATANTVGWRHVNRGLQLTKDADGRFLGEALATFGRSNIANVDQLPVRWRTVFTNGTQKQVRFVGEVPYGAGTNFSGGMTVWDQEAQQFSDYLSSDAEWNMRDACMLGNRVLVLGVTGAFGAETPGTYADLSINGGQNQITRVIRTSWVRVGQLLGFQRVYRVKFLGEYRVAAGAGGAVSVTLHKNYSPATLETVSIPDIAAYAPDGAVPGNAVIFEHHVKYQKNASFQVTITETTDVEGVVWNGLMLQIGAKPGILKQSSSFRK